jgi:hypothetical protein
MPNLFYHFWIKTVRAVTAIVFTTISPFEMVFFCKNAIAFRR